MAIRVLIVDDTDHVREMLAQMLRSDCQACVMEVSSHALEQKRVAGVEFDVDIFTNLTQDHLDYHGSMENYFAAKQKLFTTLEQGSKTASAVINIDDAHGARLAEQTRIESPMTYGLSPSARLRAREIKLGRESTELIVELPQERFCCRLPLIGRHNIYNALAAVGAGSVLKVGVSPIQTALNTLRPVPGRLENLALGQPFGVFVDYAHTDDALRNLLEIAREIVPRGRVITVFGCGGDRDRSKRPLMGEAAGARSGLVILTSDNPRTEDPLRIINDVVVGLQKANGNYVIEQDRERAIERALKMAQPGDIVLLAGKGHETYQILGPVTLDFDDREVSRRILKKL